ncbi:MAG TPA: serine hydrolase domain-containing protein [Candidatus Koribacter sp.]|jgi:CubicO group peptidase (beta-lactamase class C family)
MNLFLRRSLLLLSLFASTIALAEVPTVDTISPDLRSKIDTAVEQGLTKTEIPSASIAIVQDGKVVYTHAYGFADLNPKKPATPQMPYAVGSISKQFTASAMLWLQQQGKLSLDDPVSKYFPELTRSSEVTIRELLSHTSGYQDYWPEDYVMTSMMVPATAQSIVDQWAKKPLDFDPGTKWQYSNTNYVIAGMIFEKVSGQDLFTFLKNNFFSKLGMNDVYNYDQDGGPLVEAYYRHALGPLRVAPKIGRGWVYAAGELAMPAYDLALWDIGIMNQSLLSPESYTQFETPFKLKDGKDTGYALGVGVGDFQGHKVVAHDGEVSGFTAMNLVLPNDHIAIVVLTNQDASPGADQIGKEIVPLLLNPAGGESKPSSENEAAARKIFNGLQHGKLDRSLFTKLCNDYFTPEALSDYAKSLAPLGEPTTFHQVRESLRGGMTYHEFEATFPNSPVKLDITTYTMPDGKLEQYLVFPTP